jgi:prevent-host-death family protein
LARGSSQLVGPGRQESVQREVVEAARREQQMVTKHGKPAVVVLAAEEYERLQHLKALKAPNFANHLLGMPTDDGEFERLKGPLRESGL